MATMISEISVHELNETLTMGGQEIILLDIREIEELENGMIEGSIHMAMGEVPERMSELDPGAKIIVICRSGARSRKVTQYMMSHGFMDVSNLKEGMNGWAQLIDTSMTVY